MMELALVIVARCWDLLSDMAPYVLLGFAAAGALSVWLPQGLVERHLGGGRRLWPVFKAALAGIPIPLCCCGVIPLAASLRRRGAGRGPTTAFLISTPQTGVDSILVTYSLLGPIFAALRPLTALASGVLGGILVAAVEKRGVPSSVISNDNDVAASSPPACACGCGAACPAAGPPPSKIKGALQYGFGELPQDLARPFVLGLLAAGALAALLPPNFFQDYLGQGLASMSLMLVVGAPLYICATAAVPLAAAFLAKGLSPGAVLVFLMAAPATNLATMALVWKIMGSRTLFCYLAAVALAALAAGYGTDFFFSGLTVESLSEVAPEIAGVFSRLSAMILAALLARGLWRSFFPLRAQSNTTLP